MVLQVFQSESLLGVDKEDVVLEVTHAKDIHFLTFLPTVVVAIGCPARSGSAILLFMNDGNRAIEVIQNGFDIQVVNEGARTPFTNTFVKWTGVGLRTGAPKGIEAKLACIGLLLDEV